ncbi:MAG: hypothetical protein Q7T20_04515 [Saprospiraceae bacterium]|nr:hypothetical protein [Saprospiraceae bacterium]
MKPRLSKLLLFISLLVALSANRTWACGDMDSDYVSRFHHEHDSSTHQLEIAHSHNHCNNGSDGCASDQTDQPCSEDEKDHCHCPGCVTACHVTVLFSASVPVFIPVIGDASIQQLAFYFTEYLPETVYLPIWQPPQWMT